MRQILPAALICLFATFPVAAHGGHGGGGHGGGGHTSGGHAGGGVRSGGAVRGSGVARGGGVRFGGGFSTFRGGFVRPFRARFGFNRFYGIYPGFYGGFGYYDPFWYDSYPYPYAYPNAGYDAGYDSGGYGYQAAPSSGVIVNQDFQPQSSAPAVVQEYVPPAPEPPPPVQRKYEEAIYLIAFNDGVIRAVLAYWVDGTILHYVTLDHVQKQVPLASINRALSERFNGERNVPFQLPR
jgi:hypothetical protein